ncbi:hypothetical protein ACFVWR_15455 [Leifsonia sp. NPDC058292]|uniref:hypothetical protein n=1 Tax=Leifsonia sp. NPDC058292 TaxID=3346428 RepID=UPI0036D978AC
MEKGAKVRVAGSEGVIIAPNSGSTFEYFIIRGAPNNAVYTVLFEDTGEVRQYLESALEEIEAI